MVSSVFDPMVQEIWTSLGWNEELSRDLIDQWNLWKNLILKLSSLAVARWVNFKLTETEKVELHIFADASSKAYIAAAYISLIKTNSILSVA